LRTPKAVSDLEEALRAAVPVERPATLSFFGREFDVRFLTTKTIDSERVDLQEDRVSGAQKE
jgi:hypothetical protein